MIDIEKYRRKSINKIDMNDPTENVGVKILVCYNVYVILTSITAINQQQNDYTFYYWSEAIIVDNYKQYYQYYTITLLF